MTYGVYSEFEHLASPVDSIIHEGVVQGKVLAHDQLDCLLGSKAAEERAHVVNLAVAESEYLLEILISDGLVEAVRLTVLCCLRLKLGKVFFVVDGDTDVWLRFTDSFIGLHSDEPSVA